MRVDIKSLLIVVAMIGLVGCGGGGSGGSGGNDAPMADAGSDQNVSEGDVVSLDGNSSSDIDGDAITYS